MKRPLRALVADDSDDDCMLTIRELRRQGYDASFVRVDSAAALREALREPSFEIVLTDWSMPGFDALAVLAIVRELAPALPVLIISGTIGEETAVEALRAGASDFLVKGKLSRLGPAIDRDLRHARELAEHKHLEDQLRQAQKMEAIGALAGGVAHDFNNLLSVILSYAHFVLDSGEATPGIAGDVDNIRLAGERAVELTRQLLAFSRKQMLRPRTIDVNHLVGNMVKLLERVIGESVALSIQPGVGVGTIHADPSQVEQIVMNLAVNARDAMPRGGKLVIETSAVDLDGAYASRHHDVTPGRYVLLSFEDTGSGIDAATRARMFEPFFTTKEQGKGTGLGLSTVYGIVRQSGGHIEVRSAIGEGTTFEVFLPRSDAAIPEEAPPKSSRQTMRGTEAILLVEDDEQLRAVVRTVLRRLGYAVLDASNAGEAFLISEDHRGEIDLLITDVVMPHLSGRVLAERLLVQRPDMRVLFMSGYADDAVLDVGVSPAIEFLAKPVTPELLARKVREVLDRTDI